MARTHRYPSDLTDAEWALIEPELPPPSKDGRTLTGARQFCAIRSYLSTATKHGIGQFPALVQLAEGRPWMPATS